MVGESKKSIVQVQKSNRASTSSRRTMECRSEKPWLRSQSQKSEPTPPLSEDPNASTQIPSTILDRPSSPTITNPDTNTTAKKKGRGPTTNPSAKKRKEGKKGKVEISKRLGRVVGGLQLTKFITEMGVVLRQYAPLDVNKWAEVPMHYKDKMWADLMEKYDGLAGFRDEVMYNFNHMYRDWRHRKHLYYNQFLTDEDRLKNCPDDISESDWACLVEYFGSESFKKMSVRNKANRAKQSASSICGRKSFASVLYDMRDPITEVDPDLTEYWKATHQRRTDNTWCSDTAKNAMKQFEDVRNSQEELGDPPLSTEEHLTKAFGARSGYLRGLGCGPKPLSSKNLEAKASKEAIERQIEELKNELKQSREENEEREARLQKRR
ncbi:hypothetical protein ACMD2_26257 [Ananas comosus]|uniref:Transposase, Ptta/En/Spm, plant n=1 Tax=Ananas comosus TaxID=4615 RepID=A0A199VN74_ANACO|nr:hypothetical protein ACMD2_26257 [Ananas comosus]